MHLMSWFDDYNLSMAGNTEFCQVKWPHREVPYVFICSLNWIPVAYPKTEITRFLKVTWPYKTPGENVLCVDATPRSANLLSKFDNANLSITGDIKFRQNHMVM